MMSHRSRARLVDLLSYAYLCIASIAVLVPIMWAVLTSLKAEVTIGMYPPQWFPKPITIDNYLALLIGGRGAPRFFLNSLVLSIGTILLVLTVAAPGAYVAARFQFRGKNAMLLTILATSMIPGISILVPIYLLAIRASVLNSYPFIILVYSAWMIPQAIWFIKGFIEVVPREMEESARLDGCTVVGAFWRVVLPLIHPGLGAVAILVFIFVWNDFLIGAVLTTREEMRPVQVGLVRLIHDAEGVWWGQFTAFAVLAIAPVLLVFFLLQKRFIEGLTAGGVKG